MKYKHFKQALLFKVGSCIKLIKTHPLLSDATAKIRKLKLCSSISEFTFCSKSHTSSPYLCLWYLHRGCRCCSFEDDLLVCCKCGNIKTFHVYDTRYSYQRYMSLIWALYGVGMSYHHVWHEPSSYMSTWLIMLRACRFPFEWCRERDRIKTSPTSSIYIHEKTKRDSNPCSILSNDCNYPNAFSFFHRQWFI